MQALSTDARTKPATDAHLELLGDARVFVQGEGVWTLSAFGCHRIRQRVWHGDDELRHCIELLARLGRRKCAPRRAECGCQKAIHTRRRVTILVCDARHEHQAQQLRLHEASLVAWLVPRTPTHAPRLSRR